MALHFRASDAKELTVKEEVQRTYLVNKNSRMFCIQKCNSLFEANNLILGIVIRSKMKNEGQYYLVYFVNLF